MKTKWLLLFLAFAGLLFFLFFTTDSTDESLDLAITENSAHPLPSSHRHPDSSKTPQEEKSPPPPSKAVVSRQRNKSSVENSTDNFKKAFSKKYPDNWKFQETTTGKVFRIMGGTIKGIGKSPEAIEGLARDLAQVADITGQSFNHTSEKKTKLSTTHFVGQSFKGFEVYNAWLQATANKEGHVFIIENFVKDVDEGIPLEPHFTREQALKIATRAYEEDTIMEVKQAPAPKIWAEDRPHELVWEFDILLQTPGLEAYKVLVGAQSGRIRTKYKSSKN